MAIYLEDLNTTTATETAFTELRSLYMKSDEWKHFEKHLVPSKSWQI